MIKEYNYSNIITNKNQNDAIRKIDNLFLSENWCKYVPKFQTWPNLHEYIELKIFKETFLFSCFNYLSTKYYNKIDLWCFKNNRFSNQEDRNWHSHNRPEMNIISGIYYLRNLRKEATEFKDFAIEPKSYTWYIYPSNLMHRPPKVKSFRNRYTLAADFYY